MPDTGTAERFLVREQADPLSRLKLALSWLFVLVPALWGIAQVVLKSAALFH